jgi:ribosomal protein S4E
MLGIAQTRREGKLMLGQGKVLVDGKVVAKDDFPVGLMDVISMPDANKYYRIIPSNKGLVLSPISKEEAAFKLVRVEDKTTAQKGVQITGGKNIGKQGKIVEIEKTVAKKRRQALVVIEDATGARYQTILDFIFSVGEAEPLIAVPEASEVV